MALGRRIRLATAVLSLMAMPAAMLVACTSDAEPAGDTAPASTSSAASLPSPAATAPSSTPPRRPAPSRPKRHSPKVTPPTVPAQVNGTGVYGIGDSIMVDATTRLQSDLAGIQLNAEVGRQVSPGVTILEDLVANGDVPDTTVFGLGTNGPFLSSQLTELVHLTDGHRLIVVTTHCPYCSWTGANNAMVRAECTAKRHCYIARFQSEATRHPDWFFSDGVHLPSVGAGALAYARIVKATVCRAGGC
jgi:hypothetical protein